ncbi:MAG: hypothetical protein QM483_08435, partial [Desulfuromusa sp.]
FDTFIGKNFLEQSSLRPIPIIKNMQLFHSNQYIIYSKDTEKDYFNHQPHKNSQLKIQFISME